MSLLADFVSVVANFFLFIILLGGCICAVVAIFWVVTSLLKGKEQPSIPQTAREKIIRLAVANRRDNIDSLAWVGDNDSSFFKFANYAGHLKMVFPTVEKIFETNPETDEVVYDMDSDGNFTPKVKEVKRGKKTRYIFAYYEKGFLAGLLGQFAPPLIVAPEFIKGKSLLGVVKILADSAYPIGEFSIISSPGVTPEVESNIAHQIITDSTVIDDLFNTHVRKVKTLMEGDPQVLGPQMIRDQSFVDRMYGKLRGGDKKDGK